jgi:hypothetical protein
MRFTQVSLTLLRPVELPPCGNENKKPVELPVVQQREQVVRRVARRAATGNGNKWLCCNGMYNQPVKTPSMPFVGPRGHGYWGLLHSRYGRAGLKEQAGNRAMLKKKRKETVGPSPPFGGGVGVAAYRWATHSLAGRGGLFVTQRGLFNWAKPCLFSFLNVPCTPCTSI